MIYQSFHTGHMSSTDYEFFSYCFRQNITKRRSRTVIFSIRGAQKRLIDHITNNFKRSKTFKQKISSTETLTEEFNNFEQQIVKTTKSIGSLLHFPPICNVSAFDTLSNEMTHTFISVCVNWFIKFYSN